jgi:hypothetical protein
VPTSGDSDSDSGTSTPDVGPMLIGWHSCTYASKTVPCAGRAMTVVRIELLKYKEDVLDFRMEDPICM